MLLQSNCFGLTVETYRRELSTLVFFRQLRNYIWRTPTQYIGNILVNIYINTLLWRLPVNNAIAYADDLTLVMFVSRKNDARRICKHFVIIN